MPPSQLLCDRPLVRRIAEGEEQAHGDRLRVADVGQRREIERLELAVGPEAPANAVAALERDERLRDARRTAGTGARASAAAGGADARSPRSRRTRSARRAARAARSWRRSCRGRSATTFSAPTARAAASTDSSCRGAVGTFAVRTRPPSSEHRVRERPADVDAQDRHVRTLHRRGHPRIPLRLRRPDPRHRDAPRAPAGNGCTASTARSCRPRSGSSIVGTTRAPWSPMDHLEELVGEPLEREALNERRYAPRAVADRGGGAAARDRRLSRRRRASTV